MLALTATRVFARRYRFLRELTPVNVARHVRGKAASHTLLELRRVRCTMLKGMEPIVSPLLGKARHEAGAGPMLKRTRGLTCCGPAQEPREMGRAQAIVRVVEASLPAYPANARSLVTRASRRFDARPTPPRSAFVNDCVAIIAQGKERLRASGHIRGRCKVVAYLPRAGGGIAAGEGPARNFSASTPSAVMRWIS
jgi:hypothetical protein